MAEQVASLVAKYDDQVSAGAKAAADAINRVGDAADYSEQRVTRATKSGEQLSRQYDENARLAAKVEQVTARYARELADLERSELSLAEKEKLRSNILSQQEVAIKKATDAHARWVAGMRASEAAAGAQSSAMNAMNASAAATQKALGGATSAFGGFTGAAKGAFDSISSGGSVMEAAVGQMTGMAGGMGAANIAAVALGVGVGALAGGVGLLAAASIKAGDAMTQVEGRLRAATGSVEAARDVYNDLYQLSQKSGIAVAESAGQFVRFSIAAQEIGATRKEVVQLVDTIQKFAVVSGSTTQEAQASAQQLGQALASGKLQGDELRSILENMPVLAQSLSKELGASIGQLRAMGTAGELTSDRVFKALLRTADDANKKFEAMPLTVERASGIMAAAWERFTAEIDRSLGRSQALAATIRGMAGMLDVVTAALKPDTAMDKYLTVQRQVLELQRQINAGENGALPAQNTIKDLGNDNGASKAVLEQRLGVLREQAKTLYDAALAEQRLRERREDEERATAAATAAAAAQTAATASYKETVKGLYPLEDALIERNKKRAEVMSALESGVITFGQAQKDNAAIEADYQKKVESLTHSQRDADKAAKEAAKNEKLVDALQREFDAREQSERAMAIETATRRLNEKATSDERKEVEALAGSLYDLKASRDQDARSAQAQLRLSTAGMSEKQRDRILADTKIMSEATRRFGNDVTDAATAAAKQKWIDKERFISDTEIAAGEAEKFAKDVKSVADDIAGDVAEAMYEGITGKADSILDWFKSLFKRIAVEAIKAQIVLPITTSVVGAVPSLFGIQSPGGSAANQNGGGLLSNGNLLSLGSKFLPTGGINAAIDSWGYSALGIGTATSTVIPGIGGAAATTAATTINPATGSLAAYNSWGAAGAQGAGSGVAAGTGLSGLLGAAGAGAIGGMAAGYLGTATNSKAVGGLSGAALGAGASYLGGSLLGISAMTGPIGLGIAAAVGLITGLLGTQKATVGKTASADVTINAGGKSATYGNVLTDNDGDPAAGQALGTALSGIYSIAAMGGGKLTKDFGIGQTQKDGLYVAGSVPYKKFGDDISGLLRYTLLEQGGLKDGGANTIKALQNSKAKDWEEAAKDIGLGASIDAGNTALKEMIKTLSGVTDAAKKAADDSFMPMFDELERAKKLGIDGAYKDLATDQLKAYLDQLRNPPDFTQVQTDMATLTGQFQAARDAYAQLNPAMVTYVDQIEKETRARMAAAVQNDQNRQLNSALGRDYVNQINDLITARSVNERNALAVGNSTQRATEIFDASLRNLLSGLSASDLDVVSTLFSGSIGDLARSIEAANTATQQATRFEELFGQIRQDNINTEIASLNEQKSAANGLLSSWKNLSSSIAQARQSLLVGDLSTLDPKAKMDAALSAYRDALGKAQGGDVDAAGQVSGLAQTALQAARAYYASNEDYARIFNEVSGGLGDVESVASRQVSLQSATVSRLDTLIGVQQDALRALNQPAQADVRTLLSGLSASNLGDLVQWGQRTGSDVLMQVLQTADTKLGAANNPYRYGASADAQRIADHMSTEDFLSVGRSIGFNGSIDALNPWIVAYSKQSAFEGAVKAWGSAHGYQEGGIVRNGIWGVDSVMAKLAGGEGVLTAPATAAIGAGAVDYINRHHALPANDRWGGSNVVPYQPRQSGNSGGSSADIKRQNELLEEQNRLLTALLRTTAAAGDGTLNGLAEVADNVKAVAKKASGGGLRE
ncbi:hypothetical protein TSH7_01225 [Azospirillum sp. TSH7]|uniref:tape measure protein n=1 Tax=unclassified Azospirillum TaxID=2630922 RepID=UPI000D617C79|nr:MULTISPECIES: tape measure protein [unclassified Azospirillum]PWC69095.1 hypothetical protein TSH7_01225 [Azospirillum sp. TSH7]PWC71413.1 hypothetical protein TSH20_03850 [Azospirillum sp. TSH20]